MRCYLVRDLTAAFSNPAMPPSVLHVAGTDLVVDHTERYRCSTVHDRALVGNCGRRSGCAEIECE